MKTHDDTPHGSKLRPPDADQVQDHVHESVVHDPVSPPVDPPATVSRRVVTPPPVPVSQVSVDTVTVPFNGGPTDQLSVRARLDVAREATIPPAFPAPSSSPVTPGTTDRERRMRLDHDITTPPGIAPALHADLSSGRGDVRVYLGTADTSGILIPSADRQFTISQGHHTWTHTQTNAAGEWIYTR